MAPPQVGCDPLGVRVHSGDTGEDVSFEEVIYNGHLEQLISLFSHVLLSACDEESV